MGPGFPSEQPSLAYNLTPNPYDTGHDYPAYGLQSEFLPSNHQSNGTNVSTSRYIPYSHRPQLESNPYDDPGFEYSSLQQSVPNTPNNQSQFNSQSRFPPNDLSHTQAYDQGNLGPQGALFSSAPHGSPLQMTIDPAFSSSDELYSQSRVQGYLPYVTSLPPGQVQDAAQSHVVTQEQNTTAQEASWQREQRVQRKRKKDKERKHDTRLNDDQAYTRVCELLEIEQTPKNTLSQRILKRVESNEPDYERISKLLDISMQPRDTLPHRILVVVQGLVERQRLEGVLRHQLEETEAYVRHLKTMLAKFSTGADVGVWFPTDAPAMLGNSDTCTSLPSWP